MSNRRFLASAVAVAVVLVLALFVALAPTAPVAAQNTACFRPVGGASFECADGGSFVVQDGAQLIVESGGTLVMDGYVTSAVTDLVVAETATFTGDVGMIDDLVIGGDVDVTGNVEVTDHLLTQAELYLIPPAALTVTDGGTIVPTAAVMELSSAGAVGAEMAAAGDGQFLILINTVNQTITISETTSARMAGDFAMGQYDTITFIGQGVTWHEVARSNN